MANSNSTSRNRSNLAGMRFGKLVALEYSGSSKWLCMCDCGNTSIVYTANLKRSNTTSCGCVRNISSSKRNTIHGLHGTKVYKCWCSIKKRCNNPNDPMYSTYGGRGIYICKEWADDVSKFFKYIGHAPSETHSIDRIDNNKGYEPGNIRWATPLEQGSNKRNNVKVVFQGKEYTLAQLARYIAHECGIKPRQITDAIHSL
jgi:hypothetical protein